MLKAEKLAEIGQLAAGVAHEIRNPLAGIRGAIEVLRENKMDSELQRHVMDEILERVDRLNTAVQDLLEYAKPMSPHKTMVHLTDILESTLSTLVHDPRLQGVEIVKDYRQSVDVETDADIAERVFINIILNAAQAMKSSGKLQVTSSVATLREWSRFKTLDPVSSRLLWGRSLTLSSRHAPKAQDWDWPCARSISRFSAARSKSRPGWASEPRL